MAFSSRIHSARFGRLFVFALLCVSTLFAGCAHDSNVTTIRFMAMGREAEVVSGLIAQFEQENPGVHVDIQQIPWTAAHENLRMVFVVINNYSYRILKQRTNAMKGMAAQHDNYVAMDLDKPRVDFVQVARGLGLTAHKATTLSDLSDLLEAALAADGPTLIDVEVDRSWKPV